MAQRKLVVVLVDTRFVLLGSFLVIYFANLGDERVMFLMSTILVITQLVLLALVGYKLFGSCFVAIVLGLLSSIAGVVAGLFQIMVASLAD